ncbi:MAG: substrate-binding domain-containing protein [Turicibacter sp.]|jgi:LacI family transcriptional regulator|uniref:Catabolite control protein A n=1 Tax=Turicibacter faecis TaxID=2963365 RepID=A0ABM8IH11_9FIRM|nr:MULTISPECIES: substrate-binding domain-containing protein [unclassified Turicibacter]MCI8701126.1 substrate-binding domain-containing protein [Turicibacter sp.]BEH90540.1 catabolite control protein A [Turicibacter sp. TC023]MCI9350337.1 substrate-binding domain-containing protein [Turicibacter sp.]MCU7204298.1 substrate-binding domain-containing protein [Turicibacter sp. TA25]MCU7210107.1 substrate-binding domain-containing protein [Turicibacter sp. 1E2]
MSKVTIYDVARVADVSLATVSRVLNNPEKVKPKTRERVLTAIKELGYRPNAIARGLASRRSTNVGLIVPTCSRASASEMIDGVADIADKYRYSVFLNVTHNENDIANNAWQNMIASQVDGVLMMADKLTDDEVERLATDTVPTVLLSVKDLEGRLPAVLIDYELAAYEATKKLIENGNKDIAFITSSSHHAMNDLKEQGYRRALEEAGLEPRVLGLYTKFESSLNAFKEFFDNNKAPEAALAVRDSVAVMFMNAAIDHGINVPQDLEIIGFQNTKYAIMSRPQLSTINIPTYDIGAVAMRLLTKLMKEEEITETQITLPHSFVWRQTTR